MQQFTQPITQTANITNVLQSTAAAAERIFEFLGEKEEIKDIENPIAPSDTVLNLIAFLERNRKRWGFARDVFIDSADQATITEAQKYKRSNPCLYNFINAYKKVTVIDRIHLQLGWLWSNNRADYLVLEHCVKHIAELESYSWKEDKYEPEDRNDHTINASQYGFIPFKGIIGTGGVK
jgi:hypothetical protein